MPYFKKCTRISISAKKAELQNQSMVNEFIFGQEKAIKLPIYHIPKIISISFEDYEQETAYDVYIDGKKISTVNI